MKRIAIVFTVFLISFSAYAATLWEQGKSPSPIGKTPYAERINKGVLQITSVPEATYTFYKAKSDTPTGLVIICPGGGYKILSQQTEGTEISDALLSAGVSTVVLQYRIPDNPQGALDDIRRMIRTARANAKAWNIEPDKIAVMGFSAGANLCARASVSHDEISGKPFDEIDKLSARPDATILIYPAYCDKFGCDARWKRMLKPKAPQDYNADYALADELKIDKNTPPAFIVQAQDDVNYINASIAYALALKKNGVGVNLHIFDAGRHGFGLRVKDKPIAEWLELLKTWLKYNKYFGLK